MNDLNDPAGQDAAAVAPPGVLAAFLADAAHHPHPPLTLAAGWRLTRIAIRCPGAAGLAGNPNTPGRIRGAWGRALGPGASDQALKGGPCAWQTPCAYDVFFNSHGRLTSRLEIPKPFVIAPEASGEDLTVSLTLFGIAGDWAGEAADAMIRALRGGLDTRDGRRPVRVEGRELLRAEGVPVPDLSAGAVLEFHSPVILRGAGGGHVTPASLLTGLANRIGGLARWHGAALEVDPAALKAEALAIGAGAEWADAEAHQWRRGSRAQGRSHDMEGVTGTLWLPPVPPTLAALLAIGAETHAGGRTALGMGRYVLGTRSA